MMSRLFNKMRVSCLNVLYFLVLQFSLGMVLIDSNFFQQYYESIQILNSSLKFENQIMNHLLLIVFFLLIIKAIISRLVQNESVATDRFVFFTSLSLVVNFFSNLSTNDIFIKFRFIKLFKYKSETEKIELFKNLYTQTRSKLANYNFSGDEYKFLNLDIDNLINTDLLLIINNKLDFKKIKVYELESEALRFASNDNLVFINHYLSDLIKDNQINNVKVKTNILDSLYNNINDFYVEHPVVVYIGATVLLVSSVVAYCYFFNNNNTQTDNLINSNNNINVETNNLPSLTNDTNIILPIKDINLNTNIENTLGTNLATNRSNILNNIFSDTNKTLATETILENTLPDNDILSGNKEEINNNTNLELDPNNINSEHDTLNNLSPKEEILDSNSNLDNEQGISSGKEEMITNDDVDTKLDTNNNNNSLPSINRYDGMDEEMARVFDINVARTDIVESALSSLVGTESLVKRTINVLSDAIQWEHLTGSPYVRRALHQISQQLFSNFEDYRRIKPDDLVTYGEQNPTLILALRSLTALLTKLYELVKTLREDNF